MIRFAASLAHKWAARVRAEAGGRARASKLGAGTARLRDEQLRIPVVAVRPRAPHRAGVVDANLAAVRDANAGLMSV